MTKGEVNYWAIDKALDEEVKAQTEANDYIYDQLPFSAFDSYPLVYIENATIKIDGISVYKSMDAKDKEV